MTKLSENEKLKYQVMSETRDYFQKLLKAEYPELSFDESEVLEGRKDHQGQGDILIDSRIAVEVVRDAGGTQKFNNAKKFALLKELFKKAQAQFIQQTNNDYIWIWGSLAAHPDYEYLERNKDVLIGKLVNSAIENMVNQKEIFFRIDIQPDGLHKIFDTLHLINWEQPNPEWNYVWAFYPDHSPQALIQAIQPHIAQKEAKIDKNRESHPDWTWWLLVETPLGSVSSVDMSPYTDWSSYDENLPIESKFDHVFLMYNSRRGLKKLK